MDNNLATGAGGIPSDDDEIKHQELDTATQSSFHFWVRFILFFSKTHPTNLFTSQQEQLKLKILQRLPVCWREVTSALASKTYLKVLAHTLTPSDLTLSAS